jgi:hypothetical protein
MSLRDTLAVICGKARIRVSGKIWDRGWEEIYYYHPLTRERCKEPQALLSGWTVPPEDKADWEALIRFLLVAERQGIDSVRFAKWVVNGSNLVITSPSNNLEKL